MQDLGLTLPPGGVSSRESLISLHPGLAGGCVAHAKLFRLRFLEIGFTPPAAKTKKKTYYKTGITIDFQKRKFPL